MQKYCYGSIFYFHYVMASVHSLIDVDRCGFVSSNSSSHIFSSPMFSFSSLIQHISGFLPLIGFTGTDQVTRNEQVLSIILCRMDFGSLLSQVIPVVVYTSMYRANQTAQSFHYANAIEAT